MRKLLLCSIRPEALSLITEVERASERIKLAGNLEHDIYVSLKHSTIITSAGSSTRIEGAKLSDEQISMCLEGLSFTSIKDRDDAEVAGYIDTINYIFENYNSLSISEHNIRSFHQMMCIYLANDVLPPNQRGVYKNITNKVIEVDKASSKERIVFDTTPAGPQTEAAMKELIDDYNLFISDPNFSELQVVSAFIVKFLAIHPFRDGNGRISRLLTNLCLLRQGYQFALYSSHEKAVEENKNQYYVALRETQRTFFLENSDLNPWLIYFLKTLARQTQFLESNLQFSKVGILTKNEQMVVDLIKLHQPVSIGFIERESGIKRVTIKAILRRLKDREIIVQEGERKVSKYSLFAH